MAARANLSTPAQDNFAPIGERHKGATEGRRGPINPDRVCFNPGCTQPTKRTERKFCSRDCADAARRQIRKCVICGNRLSPVQNMNRQMTCSRICGTQLHVDRSTKHDDKFREHVRRAWCEENKTDSEIGAELGVSKNAIVGVRRRMKLPKRPTTRWPADYVPKEKRPTMAARKRPPPLRKRRPRRKPGEPKPPIATNHSTSVVASRLANAKVREASPIRVRQVPGEGCQYPISENPWRICDDPRVSPPDKHALSPYCAEHYALCFNSVPAVKRGSEDYFAKLQAA